MPLTHFLESHLHDLLIPPRVTPRWKSLGFRLLSSLISILIATGVAWGMLMLEFPSPQSLNILFVLPVLYIAVFHGFAMAMLTALLAIVSYDLLIIPPISYIELFHSENIAKLGIFVLVALITSVLASRVRLLGREAGEKEHILSGLYALSHDMVGIVNPEHMRHKAEVRLSKLLDAEVQVLLKDNIKENDAIRFCLSNLIPTGQGTAYFKECSSLYLPLKNRYGACGVIEIKGNTNLEITQRFPSKVLATLAAQTASAIEKAYLAEENERKLREAEREKFLSALLSSVSHDFKTPLVTVIGTFTSLQEMPAIRDHFGCREMVNGGLEEARKLNRFITNLVEISRLEAGIEEIHKEPVLLRDILASALKSLHPIINKQRFSIMVDDNFPLLKVNSALMELVFLNLLENAVKYGPFDGEIKIMARFDGQVAMIDIDDDGKGIPDSEREAIFVKFYRSQKGDRKIAGTGLGLYICREIVEGHGGFITAIDPHDGQGACMRITLPASATIPLIHVEEVEET